MNKLYRNIVIFFLLFQFSIYMTQPVFAKHFKYNSNTMTVEEIEDFDETEEIEETFATKIDTLTNLIQKSKDENANKEMISVLYWMRGRFYEDNHDYSSALSDYNNGLQYTPSKPILLKSIINLKIEIKDYEGALSDMNKVIKLEEKEVDNYFKRAYIYFELKQYQNAINDYTKAILIQPKNPDAFAMRGFLELMMNQKDKGFQDLGYAKQQYYDLGMYEEYQKLTKDINELKSLSNKKVVRTYAPTRSYTPLYSNIDTERQLKEINESIKNLDRTIFLK